MKEYEAKKIIKEVFENTFDKEKYTYFVKNLLKNIEIKPFGNGGAYTGNLIPKAYQNIIRKMERIGKFEDKEGNITDVLIVELKREHSVEFARSSQRNFIRWYLNGSRGGEFKDAGLVAFYSQKSPDWRFSLIKMQYSLQKGQDELTPAKLSSFLVGEKGKSHTAQKQLVGILKDDNPPYLSDLEEAFNIESVSEEFFERYKAQLFNLKDELDKIVANDEIIKKEFEIKKIDTLHFAKKLLGQIVFLYFLQRKGWLGLKQGQSYGEGDRNFLRNLFNQAKSSNENFFNDYLEFLFYDALSKKRDTDFYKKFNCRIPFLNGGLFDPINFYDWEKTDIVIPNSIFSNKTDDNDEGSGILDIFDLFNFTVKEDEPLEKEVAIDPEMLGKVFERMLEVKERKNSGAFYTPRAIVHYMTQQSLLYYLLNEFEKIILKNKGKQPLFEIKQKKGLSKLPFEEKALMSIKEDLEIFIHYGEHIIEIEKALSNGELKEGGKYKHGIPESIRKNAKFIDNALEKIKICDPAVGSGAFPVGVMNEIVRLRNILTEFIDDKKDRSDYCFKANAIEKSIYGVDIDESAVEIAKLRLWLSLVVDEENIDNIKPLPNLDYKIVQGNSLVGVEKDVLNWKLFYELEKLKPLYFKETDPAKKQEYKSKIEELISNITMGHKKFDFEVYFSEVFHQKGGFDIVIANPPYVRADNPDIKEQRKAIKKLNTYKTLWEKWDLYVAFIEKGFQLLAPRGILEYIIPDAYMTSKYAIKSHEYFLNNAVINRINFCSDLKIFEAEVRNIIIELKKEINPNHIPLRIKHLEKWENQIILPSKKQLEMGENTFKLDSENKVIGDLLNTLSWGEICYVSVGMVLNAHEKFAKGEFNKNDLISDREDKIHSRKYLEAKWMSKYTIEKIKYLEWNTQRVPKKIRRPTFPELYIPPKIMMGGMTGAIYDNTGLLCNHSITVSVLWKDLKGVNNRSIEMSIKKDFQTKHIQFLREKLEKYSEQFNLKYLLAILNSKWAYKFLDSVRRSKLGFYPDDLKKLPIKIITQPQQQPFIDLVNKILSLTQSDDYLENPQKQAKVKEYQKQIDQLVYKLYGLSEEEIKIVERGA